MSFTEERIIRALQEVDAAGENARLKKLVAEQLLDLEMPKAVARKTW